MQAVSILESEGLCCHVTHCCCLEQAAAAARADATLIQVYVARVSTWYAKHPEALVSGRMSSAGSNDDDDAEDDMINPGVQLVRQISTLVRKEHYKTKIIAASVRGRGRAHVV